MDHAKTLRFQLRVGDLDLLEIRKRYNTAREEDEDAQMCPCGKAKESRTHVMGECEMHKKERDVLEMRNVDECHMEKVSALDNSDKTFAILGI